MSLHPRLQPRLPSTLPLRRRGFLSAAFALALCACTAPGGGRLSVDAAAGWAVLPIENLSSTPLAGRQAAILLEGRLRELGADPVERLGAAEPATLAALLQPDDGQTAARARAVAARHRYALSGSVHEWHYKSAPDLEPVVGLSLRLEDLKTGQVLWQGSGARTGWGRASLSATAERAVDRLLDELHIAIDTPR